MFLGGAQKETSRIIWVQMLKWTFPVFEIQGLKLLQIIE